MFLQVDLNVDAAAVEASLREELRKLTATAFSRAATSLRAALPTAIRQLLLESPEYRSLLGGVLRFQLGVVNPKLALEQLVVAISRAAVVTQSPDGVKLEVLRSDLADALSIPAGQFTSENGYAVPWLRWLLTAGGAVLVAEYAFYPGRYIFSRTGGGIMRVPKGATSRFTPGWHVPAEFAGTTADNWLSRALLTLPTRLEAVVDAQLEGLR